MTESAPLPYTEIAACRICGGTELTSILSLGNQYLTGVFPREEHATLTCGPLEIVICRSCELVQLRHSYNPQEMYGANYGYRSGLNRSMVRHLAEKADLLAARAGLTRGHVVLDIGSSDGTLLNSYQVPGIQRIGMDPSGESFRQHYSNDSELIPDFFSARRFLDYSRGRRVQVVTSIGMFYDLADPLGFVREVAEVLDDEGLWYCEQSYLPTMMAATAYDTICHEHIEYYRLKQFAWLTGRADLKIVDIALDDVNGGSFGVTVARKASGHVENTALIDRFLEQEDRLGLSTLRPYSGFAARVFAHRDKLIRFIGDLNAGGKTVFGYGASTKGNVVLQFCGITRKDIPCIAEVNSRKFGCYTPGTRIPIVSEEEARAKNPDYFLVLPWHFRDGIVARERRFLASGGRLLFPLPELNCIPSHTHAYENDADQRPGIAGPCP